MVRVLLIVCFIIDHDLTLVSSNYETSSTGLDSFDEERLSWRLLQHHFVVTVALAKHDLALVRCYKELSFLKPAVRCVICRDVCFFLLKLLLESLELLVFSDFEVAVGVVSRHQHHILVD